MYICLFDIDGTLLSSGGAGKAAMGLAMTATFGVQEPMDGITLSGRTDRAITRDLFRLHGVDETPDNWQRFHAAYLHHLPSSLNTHRGAVLPGIASLLEYLQTRDTVAVGLLTGNLREGARLKLGHYGIYHHFGFGGFGDHHFDRDDVAREALAAVASHLKRPVNGEQVWVIGDTPLDIRCARAIGARVAAVATGWHPLEELAKGEPDLLLGDLTDPSPLLKHWG